MNLFMITTQPSPEVEALIPVLILIYAVTFIAAFLINGAAFAFFFKKVGVEPWKGFVPFWNMWIFFKLGGVNPLISLLILTAVIPFIGIVGVAFAAVYSCIAAYKIGLAFNKEGWWVLLYIFVPLVWLLVLAFDSSTFNPKLYNTQY